MIERAVWARLAGRRLSVEISEIRIRAAVEQAISRVDPFNALRQRLDRANAKKNRYAAPRSRVVGPLGEEARP